MTRYIEPKADVPGVSTLLPDERRRQPRQFDFVSLVGPELWGRHRQNWRDVLALLRKYVHYSDLNHQMVKWTFYVMLEAIERLALENLRPGDQRTYLKEKLGPGRFKQIEGMYERAGDNGRSLMTYLNLADILRLAVSDSAIQLDETSIRLMKNVRDWAAHVLYDLSPETAVRNLVTVKGECLRLLGSTGQAERVAASA